MTTPPLIGTSTTNSIELSPDLLGAPGSVGHLIVAAQFSDDRFQGRDRYNDRNLRQFDVKARLAKHPPEQGDINGDIQPESGSSFLLVPESRTHIEMGIKGTSVLLTPNSNRELAMASADLLATNPHEARLLFETVLAPCLDRLSYVRTVPIHVALITVRDTSNEVQYVYYRSPARRTTIDNHEETLFEEMRPLYALYGEAQNSSSPYYRVLCFYKIMEGLLGPLQASVYKRAEAIKKTINIPKARVPSHPNISGELKVHVDTPMKSFFDNFLTTEYRNAVAHFELTGGTALNVSSAVDVENFARVSFLADVCVRSLIARHEQALHQLYG